MPLYHKPRSFTPLLIAAEKKSVKNGCHHAIFTSRFDRYVGDWKHDLKEGKGLFLTIGGKLYEGDWYKGFRHGFGTLSHQLENKTFSLEYRGEWVRGKPEGAGWWYYANGDVYFGFLRRGKRHGYGKMWYKDGTLYAGYWNMGQREGLGMFVQGNGNRYEGHWEKNMKNGIGRFYHMHTGQLQEGCWLDDVCVKSKMSDIVIRQCCIFPTPYALPPTLRGRLYLRIKEENIYPFKLMRILSYLCSDEERLVDSKAILEQSELWLQQKVGDIDKQLKHCIDQMDK